MLTINHNESALKARRRLSQSAGLLRTSMERLSSGLRINSAKDDVAGVAIADRMTSQIRGLNQAARNANDGISLAQTADGALQEAAAVLQRIRELAVQSANDTNVGTDRASLQKEVGQLQQELNRIANTTAFNGKNLLDGTFEQQKFHIGANANQTISIRSGNTQATAIGAHTVRSYSTSGNGGMSMAVSGTSVTGYNNVVGGTLRIAGALGSTEINVNTGDSARTISVRVNEKTAETGVTAQATTQLQLTVSGASGGMVSFNLIGQNETKSGVIQQSVKISYNLLASSTTESDDDALEGLAATINSYAGTTGITAKVNQNKTGIILEQSNGYDIKLTGNSDSTVSLAVQGLTFDATDQTAVVMSGGYRIAGSAVALSAGSTHTVIVGGQVVFQSGIGFSVTSSGTNVVSSAFSDIASGISKLNTVANIDISTQIGANDAISVVDNALNFIDDLRADFGAVQNRLASTINNLQISAENISDARSRIQDADFAKETADLSRAQILQQAGIAILAQANQSQQVVMQLLQK